MNQQTDHWRYYAVLLIAELRRTGSTFKQIATVLGLSEGATKMIYQRWKKVYI